MGPNNLPLKTCIGRILDNTSELTTIQIPWDGVLYLFPLADLSVIYGLRMELDGSISRHEYVPVVHTEPQAEPEYEAQTDDRYEELKTRIDILESKIRKLENNKPYYKKGQNNGPKRYDSEIRSQHDSEQS